MEVDSKAKTLFGIQNGEGGKGKSEVYQAQ